MLSIIVAHTRDRIIGKNGTMPWHLPKDLAYFKKVTLGSPVIMGRKTFESIGKPLVNRLNIVITRNKDLEFPEGVVKCQSLKEAIELTKEHEQAFVIGGGTIYNEAIKFADKLYITYIDANIEGDTYFPEYALDEYQLITEIKEPKDEKNAHDLIFKVYSKK